MRLLKRYFFSYGQITVKKKQFSTNSRAVLRLHIKPARFRYFSTKKKIPLEDPYHKLIPKLKKLINAGSVWSTKRKSHMIVGVSFGTFLLAYMIYFLGSLDADSNDDLEDEPVIIQYLTRAFRELRYGIKLVMIPSREKLLPDPLPFPYIQPRYTLVLELTDVLVHSEWTFQTGWRYKKRPLSDYFLETLREDYEIIIYTSEQGSVAFPLLEVVDTKNVIAHKLVRDATYFSGGHYIKTLNKLNRDLSKVIYIDWNPKNVKFNIENLFNIKRWSGNENDRALLDLALFLKTIAANNIEDVREVLKYYSQYDDPVEAFKEKQRQLIEELEKQAKDNNIPK